MERILVTEMGIPTDGKVCLQDALTKLFATTIFKSDVQNTKLWAYKASIYKKLVMISCQYFLIY